jgi:hypothetical protein
MENEHSILPAADLKAEFLAASLLVKGLKADQLLLQSLGPFRRRSHRDVESISEQEKGHFRGTVIAANRSGLYDYLPEQLFHLPSPGKTLKEKIEQVRQEREKEHKTRLFFQPLEQEFFLHKVLLCRIEQQAAALDPDTLLFAELRKFWQIPDFVSDDTLIRLLPLLPEMSGCRADFERSANMLTKILELEVTIVSQYEQGKLIMEGAALGGVKLGIDLLLGGQMETHLPTLHISLSLKDREALELCFTNPNFDDLLTWLLGRLLPVEFNFTVQFTTRPTMTYLPDEDDALSPRLGFTAWLI